MMNIDILPTIAEITGSRLPDNMIDGKSVWSIWKGESETSPHIAYYFYYHVNELHGVRYKDWKLYFPHRYRTLNGRPGGQDGLPEPYDYNELEEIALYDLSEDIEEKNNVAKEFPDVVREIQLLANQMRLELGDALQEQKGIGTRQPGIIAP